MIRIGWGKGSLWYLTGHGSIELDGVMNQSTFRSIQPTFPNLPSGVWKTFLGKSYCLYPCPSSTMLALVLPRPEALNPGPKALYSAMKV